MTAHTRDLAQAAAVRDYRRYATAIERDARDMDRQGKSATAKEWRARGAIAARAANREARPEEGA